MKRWKNWSGSVDCQPTHYAEPSSAEALADAIEAAAGRGHHVRIAGSGHSFTPVVASDATLLSLRHMRGVTHTDREAMTATLLAGTPIAEIGAPLHEAGLGLLNQGDVHPQAIAGAVATGTHGTGKRLGSLSEAVAGFELVTADGQVRWCSRNENAELFEYGRVALGSLGVMTRIEMRVREAYKLEELKRNLPLREVLDEAERTAASVRHWEFHWFPYSELAATKVMEPTHAEVRPERLRHFFVDTVFENAAWWMCCQATRMAPGLNQPVARFAAKTFSESSKVDWSYKVFPNPRMVRFNEMEYAVPAAKGPEVLLEIKDLIEREQFDVAFPIEYRYVQADDIPLSPFYRRDAAVLSCHVFNGKPYACYFEAVEAVFRKHGGRPHWGKMHHLQADDLRALYDRYDDFQALRARVDPQGVFQSPYIARIFGDVRDAA